MKHKCLVKERYNRIHSVYTNACMHSLWLTHHITIFKSTATIRSICCCFFDNGLPCAPYTPSTIDFSLAGLCTCTSVSNHVIAMYFQLWMRRYAFNKLFNDNSRVEMTVWMSANICICDTHLKWMRCAALIAWQTSKMCTRNLLNAKSNSIYCLSRNMLTENDDWIQFHAEMWSMFLDFNYCPCGAGMPFLQAWCR